MDKQPQWSWTILEGYCTDHQQAFVWGRNSPGVEWLFKHTNTDWCLCVFHEQRQQKTIHRRDYLWDEILHEMATEQLSLSAFFDSSTEQPPAIFFLFPRYLLHLPHMSDNIKTCCSSKVSLIKSTHISADKTANVKMVKKQTFLSIALILYVEWWTEDALLIDAGHYGIWGLCLYSILSPLQY